MTQFTPATEVDFVVIGSGAAGGIMAKQLSVAGFSVVVLEQGGWGKYGHEQDYTKDEWLNRNPGPEDRLMSDPAGRQAQHLPQERQGKGRFGHALLRVRRGGRDRHVRGQQLAPPAVGVQRSQHRGSDCRHRHGGLADLLRGAGALLHAGRVGDGHLGTARQFPVCGADVEGLSGTPGAAEVLRCSVQRGGRQARLDRRAWPARDHYAGVHGPLRVRQLRDVFGLRVPRARAIELGGHGAPYCPGDRPL